ncbi:hypothetical protein GCM10023323_73020 [Streptomyces thinghirensis]|uniref:Uncharacterized protein n=1 Tax=Streptomyces thinghirensis TaxID=551547 RepID=A0ABP9TGG7_9ACTN
MLCLAAVEGERTVRDAPDVTGVPRVVRDRPGRAPRRHLAGALGGFPHPRAVSPRP